MDDALSAEERAIRYADLHRGHRSGHFVGNDAYRQVREECMATLFEAVANHHGVTPAQVRDALVYRRSSTDFFVIVMFAAFYVAIANAIIHRTFRSVPSDALWIRFLVSTGTACGTAIVGLLLFNLYSDVFEMLRVGNTHMSYRVGRDPWRQQQVELLGGMVLFALLAWYRHARDRAHDREPGAIERAV
jgi:hypothetical protein